MRQLVPIVLAITLFVLGGISAQGTGSSDNESTDDTDNTAESDTLDCSNKPCELTCPRFTTYRAGTNCTDACVQTVCNTTMACGCYCTDNYRKINGKCVRKTNCPKISTSTGGGRPGFFGGGGLLGGRRKNIMAMLQQIREQMDANQNK